MAGGAHNLRPRLGVLPTIGFGELDPEYGKYDFVTDIVLCSDGDDFNKSRKVI